MLVSTFEIEPTVPLQISTLFCNDVAPVKSPSISTMQLRIFPTRLSGPEQTTRLSYSDVRIPEPLMLTRAGRVPRGVNSVASGKSGQLDLGYAQPPNPRS